MSRAGRWARVGLILLLAVLLVTVSLQSHPIYLHTIKLNWGVPLPAGCRQLHERDSGPSFHGDGLRYHLFRYRRPPALGEGWQAGPPGQEQQKEVADILTRLGVGEALHPDFGSTTHSLTRRQRDGSRLYLLYTAYDQKLYAVESFL